MQYAATAFEAIKQSNWWVGVGSIGFSQAYQDAATSLKVTPQSWATYNWGNPHNEYLYMLATKGVIGLVLYLAVFAQACRVAWQKTDEVQRVGLVMFVFLFMLSITTNSMMIDMEEGHFTLLILLIFLAPKTLNLSGPNTSDYLHKRVSA
jgi:O-antigen ligase